MVPINKSTKKKHPQKKWDRFYKSENNKKLISKKTNSFL